MWWKSAPVEVHRVGGVARSLANYVIYLFYPNVVEVCSFRGAQSWWGERLACMNVRVSLLLGVVVVKCLC